MLFHNKPRLLINNDLLFRSNRLAIDNRDCLVIDNNFEWTYSSLYEVTLDTKVNTYLEGQGSDDHSICNIYPVDDVIFQKGDRIVCVGAKKYHSITGTSHLYFDYYAVRYQINNSYNINPDICFAEIVRLNELEYIDYLYGTD